MPDTPQQPTPPAPTPPAPPPSPPASGGTPTSAAPELPTSMVAPEYRYPSNDATPEWARGKTAGEMLQLMQGVIEGIGRNAAPAAPPPAPAPLGDEDYVTNRDLKAAQTAAISQLSPYLKSVADQQATVSYSIAKRDHAETFKKHEPEIIAVLQRVPRENWTLDVIENAVTFVKGKHVDEIAAEKVRQFESRVESTMRSTGRAGLVPGSQPKETAESAMEKVPEDWRKQAKAVGLDPLALQELCWANEITIDDFFNQFKDGIVTDAVADVSYKPKYAT